MNYTEIENKIAEHRTAIQQLEEQKKNISWKDIAELLFTELSNAMDYSGEGSYRTDEADEALRLFSEKINKK